MKKIIISVLLMISVFVICGYVYTDSTIAAEQESSIAADTDTWVHDSNGWRYINSQGQYVTSSWLKVENIWYYFGADSYMKTGWQMIDGKWYYFAKGGAMQTGWLLIDGYWYKFANNGVMKTGWFKEDNNWHYLKDGSMISDQTFDIKNETTQSTEHYRFDAAGCMIKGWYEDAYGVGSGEASSSWYYYLPSGKAASGLKTVDGIRYFFDNNGFMNKLYTGYYDIVSGMILDINYRGVVTAAVKVKSNGWTHVGDHWYYFEDGEPAFGWRKICNYWYYFGYGPDGQMAADRYCQIYNESLQKGEVYRFDGSGHIIKGWYTEEDKVYYYKRSGAAATGITTIDGKQFFFNSIGLLLKNYSHYDNEAQTFTVTDENGVVTVSASASYNGWFKTGGFWCYLENGQPARGWRQIGGYWYYFGRSILWWDENDFYMCQDRSIYIDEDSYSFDKHGHMITGWNKNHDGNWSYYDQEGKRIYDGVVTLKGVTYLIRDGYLNYDSVMIDGNTMIRSDSKGRVIATASAQNDGWNKLGNDWCYAENGAFICDQVKLINGKYYGFGYDGIMLYDTVIRMDGPGGYGTYRFNSSGIMATGWFRRYENDHLDYIIDQYEWVWYYFNSDGKAAEGFQMINGKQYYFDNNKHLMISDRIIDGQGNAYIADANGVLTPSTEVNGWGPNKSRYYINGQIVTGWKKIDGKWYYFDNNGNPEDGHQCINGKYYYFDSGEMKIGWFMTDWVSFLADGWRYANPNGVLARNEWRKIDDKWYYFDDVIAADGVKIIDGEIYLFNSDGTYIRKITKDGWVKNDKHWYYVEDGRYLMAYDSGVEEYIIDGKIYSFNRKGELLQY